jgi:hypothetical protein
VGGGSEVAAVAVRRGKEAAEDVAVSLYECGIKTAH